MMTGTAAREEPGTARMTGAMYPGEHAATMPDRAAAIHAETGATLTYKALPRLPTGKLYKAALRDQYRQQQQP